MLRDFKFLQRNSAKADEAENVPVSRKDIPPFRAPSDPCRPPLNSIQDPARTPSAEQDVSSRSKVDKTPTKAKGKALDSAPALPLRTPPEKVGAAASVKNRFGWKNEYSGAGTSGSDFGNWSAQVSGRYGGGGGVGSMIPRAGRTVGKGPAPAPAPSFSECHSTQSIPTKSVSKPPSSIARGKVDSVVGARGGNFGVLYRGSTTVVNSVEVPHFDLKEDPSFWMEHNV